jgi:hypothetical protein
LWGGYDDGGLGKKKLYHDQHLMDVFLSLAIKVFGCLHE